MQYIRLSTNARSFNTGEQRNNVSAGNEQTEEIRRPIRVKGISEEFLLESYESY